MKKARRNPAGFFDCRGQIPFLRGRALTPGLRASGPAEQLEQLQDQVGAAAGRRDGQDPGP
ncbi:hypothetical protein, partial [Mesorhizobium sp. M2E.F.Ca.ET.209.01.1.1]|uniref:hypothetical protein n=1 Tax=Mesorhizobium sp. M2E.F.Ca.ET.209.01.1.1 TaxID=2500526 RepID=UPI001AEE3924